MHIHIKPVAIYTKYNSIKVVLDSVSVNCYKQILIVFIESVNREVIIRAYCLRKKPFALMNDL